MKLDLLYEIDAARPWGKPHPWGQREAEQRSYREAIEQIKLADNLGFHTTWHVEHHFREARSHQSAPEAVLGALSQVTENINLGFGVTLVPYGFTHPARVAEKVATVDILSNGRVQWGIGRSQPMERAAFHVDHERSKIEMIEAAKQIVDMWEQEYYECDDEFLKFPKRMVTPKPFQYPHPDPWMATGNVDSARRAGENGFGMLSFAILQPLGDVNSPVMADARSVGNLVKAYREAIANCTTPATRKLNNKVAVYTLVHCADSIEKAEENRAWDSVWWWYKNLAEFTLQWEMAHMAPNEQQVAFPHLFAEREKSGEWSPQVFNDEDMVIVGDPDSCYEKMVRYAELGIDELICYMQFGYLPHESVMRSIELIGTELRPELEKLGVEVEAKVVPASR
jgi:alkanesulfonate monooxygenase SsuD/methylene tetrahydromethanopterin reductase-like flavin-dependent oxidoreductase (luciferase family)